MSKLLRCCLAYLCFVTATTDAAVLQVDSVTELLTGATGVNVGGTLFDVSFQDGACASLYSGCDSPANVPLFPGVSGDALSAQALLDQVFIDGPSGTFDTNPVRIKGCESVAVEPQYQCLIVYPHNTLAPDGSIIGVLWGQVNNANDEGFDLALEIGFFDPAIDTGNLPGTTFAVWRLPVTGVSEPGSLACLGVAGMVLMSMRRGKSKRKCASRVPNRLG